MDSFDSGKIYLAKLSIVFPTSFLLHTSLYFRNRESFKKMTFYDILKDPLYRVFETVSLCVVRGIDGRRDYEFTVGFNYHATRVPSRLHNRRDRRGRRRTHRQPEQADNARKGRKEEQKIGLFFGDDRINRPRSRRDRMDRREEKEIRMRF